MLDKGWISRGIHRLVDSGLVERAPDETDKRRVQLRLSPAGRVRATALDDRLNAHAASLLSPLSPVQDGHLASILEQVLINLDPNLRPPFLSCSGQQVLYRRALPSDWPQIQELLRTASLPTEDAADHLARFTVGVSGADVIAVGGFEDYGADALLRSFVVARQLRGQHHGSALLRHVLRDAGTTGVKHVYLLTESAAPFFERHGFLSVARKDAPPAIRDTREFKQLCPASACLMALSLSNLDDTPC
ncbi:GNAT family N-acetyltransferase [Massilia sp. TW-1]|uniref:GNAT family N-acetyltransferase n=2 Tax=Telluria antibiotica TaxID=2717319 RepID=A0ABX0P8H5_9BURK|nr:GNAT family N-acetyltransferase [Telluria antibiotica]